MANKSKTQADFLVNWTSANNQHSANENEQVSIESLVNNAGVPASNRLRNAAASLYTDKTYIEVSDLHWQEPVSLSFTPFRVGFSSLVTTTGGTVEYGYEGEALTSLTGVGNLLFMLPGKTIHANVSPGRLCTVTCSFEQSYAETLLGPLQDLSVLQVQKALDMRSSLISGMMLRLMQEATYPGAVSESIADAFGQAILVECAHWLSSIEAPASSGQLTAREFETIERYLAGLSGQSATVADLAKVCGLSERYFAKLFRAQTGLSVSQYIKTVKITKAKMLLLETNLPLKTIAFQLGYSNAANFSSFFRSATGMSPGQFRDSNE